MKKIFSFLALIIFTHLAFAKSAVESARENTNVKSNKTDYQMLNDAADSVGPQPVALDCFGTKTLDTRTFMVRLIKIAERANEAIISIYPAEGEFRTYAQGLLVLEDSTSNSVRTLKALSTDRSSVVVVEIDMAPRSTQAKLTAKLIIARESEDSFGKRVVQTIDFSVDCLK